MLNIPKEQNPEGIKIGDVVVLKSGGSKMVVEQSALLQQGSDQYTAKCAWHNTENKPESRDYCFTSLKIDKP